MVVVHRTPYAIPPHNNNSKGAFALCICLGPIFNDVSMVVMWKFGAPESQSIGPGSTPNICQIQRGDAVFYVT
jgi:hypothetical protein